MESSEIKPGRGNETGEAADECIGIEGDMGAAGENFSVTALLDTCHPAASPYTWRLK